MDAGWEEVERMAQAAYAADAVVAGEEPTEEQIARWRRLFNYTRFEALNLIKAQRSDLTRTRITDDHWALVQAKREAAGHDRETYEHSQQLGNVLNSRSGTVPGTEGKPMIVFSLGGVLDSAEKVREILTGGLGELPRVVDGWSELGRAKFCIVDEEAKRKIDAWLAQTQVIEKTH